MKNKEQKKARKRDSNPRDLKLKKETLKDLDAQEQSAKGGGGLISVYTCGVACPKTLGCPIIKTG